MVKNTLKILIVDDDKALGERCVEVFRKNGCEAKSTNNGQKALNLIQKQSFDVMLIDIRLPDISGLELLKKIKYINKNIIPVMITGYGTIDIAVQAMKYGAWDFICKPFDFGRLLELLENLKNEVLKGNHSLSPNLNQFKSRISEENFVYSSDKMQEILWLVEKVAPTDCPILIEGETGVGKGLIANLIHKKSKRSNGPLVVVDCAALPHSLIESELFGYVKGAFTGANADKKGYFHISNGGTLVLDEISELSLSSQGKLLRVTQENKFIPVGSTKPIEFNSRIIAISNRDLEFLVKKGEFRPDLYFRLNVVKIKVPPLRERKEDILPLAKHFFERFKLMYNKDYLILNERTIRILETYDWPGNVRELENVIHQLVLMSEESPIDEKDIITSLISPKLTGPKLRKISEMPLKNPVSQWRHQESGDLEGQERRAADYKMFKKDLLNGFTKHYIEDVLRQNKGNISKAAQVLSIRRTSLQRILKRLNIKKDEFLV